MQSFWLTSFEKWPQQYQLRPDDNLDSFTGTTVFSKYIDKNPRANNTGGVQYKFIKSLPAYSTNAYQQ